MTVTCSDSDMQCFRSEITVSNFTPKKLGLFTTGAISNCSRYNGRPAHFALECLTVFRYAYRCLSVLTLLYCFVLEEVLERFPEFIVTLLTHNPQQHMIPNESSSFCCLAGFTCKEILCLEAVENIGWYI